MKVVDELFQPAAAAPREARPPGKSTRQDFRALRPPGRNAGQWNVSVSAKAHNSIMPSNTGRVRSSRIMSKKKLFALSTALTTCAMLEVFYLHRARPRPVPVLVSESGDHYVYVSSQISVRDIGYIARRGIRLIVMD